jgi:CspA family cold shock protein
VKTGVVKFFNTMRDWGFIAPDDHTADVFVHYSAIEGEGFRDLQEGDKVRFEVVDKGKVSQAQDVQRVGGRR